RQFARQEFQGDGLTELQVIGAIDFAHAATPEETDDPVAVGENGARREATDRNRIRGDEATDAHRRDHWPGTKSGRPWRDLRDRDQWLAARRTKTAACDILRGTGRTFHVRRDSSGT